VCRDSVAQVFRIPTDGSGQSHIYQSRSYSVIRPRGPAVPRGGTAGRVFEQFGDVNPRCCRTRNLGPPLPERVAGSLRLPPDAPPVARVVTHPDVGALFHPGVAIAVCVGPAVPSTAMPGRLKSTIQDSPGAHCRQCLRGTGWRRPGATAVPPRGPPRS